MKLHAIRLQKDDDLRPALEEFVAKAGIGAGFVAGAVGSLSRACLRFADAPMPDLVGGPLEIVVLSGTLSPDGCHLHVAASDGSGRVIGGHVMPGCIVRTTAELVIGEIPELAFAREPDAATGHRELVVKRRKA
jgi:predicted DNA-binding protein with PD1-like motif